MRTTPVLIVGGGPTGLSMAIVLARHGVRSLLVERHATTTDHPKARAVNVRTMELFRQWGVEDAVCDGALSQDFLRFIWCKTLAGEEIARIETSDGRRDGKSPTVRRIVSQDVVEQTLHQHASTLPAAKLEFSTELRSFRETRDGVDAELVDAASGKTRTCRARYMVAADGASSFVRRRLGIAMNGPAALSHQMSVYFRADLTPWTAQRPADIYYCTEGDWIGVVNGTTRWLCIARHDAGNGGPPPVSTTEEYVARIRRSVGIPDLPVEVINATLWKMGAQAAARFRSGPVFLAGDAAHVMAPTGGFGMNTGIQDAHNLGWKLAAVLAGETGPALLDTYEAERKPVAESNAAWSAGNARRIWGIQESVEAGEREAVQAGAREQVDHISSAGRALGFRYASSAVIADGAPAPAFSTQTYLPAASPGARAPHTWLVGKRGRLSILDLFERDWVLLTGSPGDSWRAALERVEPALRAGVRLVTIGSEGDFEDPTGNWRELYGLERGGAVLVRPDGHVAWRGPTGDARAGGALDDVLASVLHRRPAGAHAPDMPAPVSPDVGAAAAIRERAPASAARGR